MFGNDFESRATAGFFNSECKRKLGNARFRLPTPRHPPLESLRKASGSVPGYPKKRPIDFVNTLLIYDAAIRTVCAEEIVSARND